MPTYSVFLLDYEGNVLGARERLEASGDYAAQRYGRIVQAAGGCVEILFDRVKVFPIKAN